MLVLGFAVGGTAFLLADSLDVRLPYSAFLLWDGNDWPEAVWDGYVDTDGSPLFPQYLAYFGFLFLILCWWRQANPLRRTRLSLWALACCVLWALIIFPFWPFPQPWGLMIAAVISLSVQLASPWSAPEEPTFDVQEV